MTSSTGNFAELLWPGIKEIYGHKYAEYPQIWSQILDRVDSNKAFEKFQGLTSLGQLAIKDQGAAFVYDNPMQGFQKEAVNVTYALGASCTKEMYDDEQYGYINSLPEMLARATRMTEETQAANPFNSGFSTATTPVTAQDALSLFNTAHLRVDGGTFRNQLATASDLTQTALEQADIDVMDWVDDRGQKLMAKGVKLIVPTALKHTARKILETDKAVDSADNTKNTVAGSLDLVVWPYLTDTDAWFIKTDQKNGVLFVDREAATIDRDNEFTTRNLVFATFRRFSVVAVDPRGAFGSPGA
jgi:hypothetical protein